MTSLVQYLDIEAKAAILEEVLRRRHQSWNTTVVALIVWLSMIPVGFFQ